MTKPESKITPRTLGDVLYARAKPALREAEWVALVRQIAAGDQQALHHLYDIAHGVVFTYALRITRSRENAEEVTLDVFHEIWRHAGAYDSGNGTVLGWIMNRARSRSIDRVRFENRKKRTDSQELQEKIDPVTEMRDEAEQQDHRAWLAVALQSLTADERAAIEVTFFAGHTHDEAAKRLNQPLGTIKTRIRSGLRKLRAMLAAESEK